MAGALKPGTVATISHGCRSAYPMYDAVFKSSPIRNLTDDGTQGGRIARVLRETYTREALGLGIQDSPKCSYCGGSPGHQRTCRGCGAPTEDRA
jgi:hypothetical protein